MIDGEFVSYFENGEIKEKGRFNKGQPNGEHLSFYEGKIPAKRMHFDKGLLEGEQLRFFPSGKKEVVMECCSILKCDKNNEEENI